MPKKAAIQVTLMILFTLITSHIGRTQTIQSSPDILILKIKTQTARAQTGSNRVQTFGAASLDAISRRFGIRNIQRLFPATHTKTATNIGLNRILKIAVPETVGADELRTTYEQDANVEYVQRNHIYRIDAEPNDPLLTQQDVLDVLQAKAAWDVQLASPKVIVGIIDTGIDYLHEDLRDALWMNSGEDLNANGAVDSTDFNGIDDDGNGFVDDIRGWDFTDAPAFPDGGDFTTPDNDPFDENGHGTSVAGIIGATGNNGTGIAGLAYGCRIMNLRAGTSRGFLEEDDVASAIVYAVENGARIINMSFGDEVASPLLQDVIQFAFQQNCILVASAGNSATDKIHFPSGFSETISVGATDLQDNLASFSNYGSSVDLVAPGRNIFTTKRKNAYGNFSGTSASAPLVSALAALVLSKTFDHSPASLKGLLISSTDDLGATGWDNFFAAGRINALKAVQSPYFSVAKIHSPKVNQGFTPGRNVPIVVTATGTFLSEIVLEFGVGETPNAWQELTRIQNRQIVQENIFDLNIDSLADTLYTLRLIVKNQNGGAVEDKVPFFIDRTAPHITNVHLTPMLDGERHSVLIEFTTDDLSDATVFVRSNATAGGFEEIPLRFRATEHRFLINRFLAPGAVSFYVKAVNTANLTSVDDNNGAFYTVDIPGLTIPSAPVLKTARAFPAGFFLKKTADFDGDGKQEIILNQYQNDFSFDALKILEIDGDDFHEVFATKNIFIPRDWGDADGDGLPEILTGNGPKSFIFEAENATGFPNRIVWADTVNNAWASRFTDLDQDGRGEIILRLDDLYTVWETIGDNSYALTDSFPNPTAGTNSVGVPHTEVGDFDGDGLTEILFGDGDGDVIIYENSGDNRYDLTWTTRMPLTDATDYLAVGDFDGDGVDEFAVGTHTDENLNLESNFDSRHWLFRIYKSSGDNRFQSVWEQAFFGFQSPKDFDSGVAAGDVDNDGRAELLISVFPDFYLVDYDAATATYKVIWHTQPARSNTTLTADFNRDGLNEFYVNDGNAMSGYRFLSQFTGPPTPTAFKVRPLGRHAIELSWQPTTSPNGFQIYRTRDDVTLSPLSLVESPPFTDTKVVEGVPYKYAVTALDSTFQPAESLLTPIRQAIPNAKPFVQAASFSPPEQIVLTFSEPMNQSVKNQTNYDISGTGPPRSAIFGQSGHEVILTVPGPLLPGEHTVNVKDVADLDATPLDSSRNSARFMVPKQSTPPYLVRVQLAGNNLLRLTFNEAMDPASASEVGNYRIQPEVKVQAAALKQDEPNVVLLEIDPDSPIGPFGVDYFITVRGVQALDGRPIQFGLGDTAALIFSSPDLKHVFAYPNPYRVDSGQTFVTIAGLTKKATVHILDANGRLIRTLEETDGNGGLQWDMKNETGESVASGIYIFYVTGNGGTGKGKLAIVK